MCTLEKKGDIFYLTVTGDDEHRLNPSLIASIAAAISKVKSKTIKGSVLITKAEGKFFSNGFDLAYARSANPPESAMDRLSQMVDLFKPIISELISLPMPTIAAVTGHAAAAGMLLALSHDYVMMRSDRGVLYMSEIDIGLPLPDYFTAVIRSKISSQAVRREVVLKAAKVRAKEAVEMGLVDSAHESAAETVAAAERLAVGLAKRKWDGENYAVLRKQLLPEACAVFGLSTASPVVRSRL